MNQVYNKNCFFILFWFSKGSKKWSDVSGFYNLCVRLKKLSTLRPIKWQILGSDESILIAFLQFVVFIFLGDSDVSPKSIFVPFSL